MGTIITIGDAFNAKKRELKHDSAAGHADSCQFNGLGCIECCCGLPNKKSQQLPKSGSSENFFGAGDDSESP